MKNLLKKRRNQELVTPGEPQKKSKLRAYRSLRNAASIGAFYVLATLPKSDGLQITTAVTAMPKSLHNLNWKGRAERLQTLGRCIALLLIVCFGLASWGHEAVAQSQPKSAEESPLCSRDNALDMIKQQLELAKTFNKTVPRITVLIRAADLLWPYQQDKSRSVFAEAFELASENEKENAQTGPRALLLRLQVPDQRFIVIRAVARRDPALAKELTGRALKISDDSEVKTTRNSLENEVTAARLLDSASKLIATDNNASFDLAIASLNYPASSWLTRFLYDLAKVNQHAADQFYAQALSVYGNKPIRELLYLQAYPFAWRETLNTPIFSFYQVPENFVANRDLQRRFVQTLLRRAHQALEAPPDQNDIYRESSGDLLSGPAHILQGLIRLEPQVKEFLPELIPSLMDTREKILVSLSLETQKLLLQPGREISTKPNQTFDEKVESALKLPDVYERDEAIATALFSSEKESLPSVIAAIEKISDSNLRARFLEWIYFRRAFSAITNKQFDEAERYVSKVEGLEERAFLHIEIAKGLLSIKEMLIHAREVLDEAITEAKKAGVTIFAARTLLTASTLYATIDVSRSIEVLTDAINCVNRIEAPDFVSDHQALEKRPRRGSSSGRYRGEYNLRFYMPGLDPEGAFREVAKIDFDTTLSQSSTLTDKYQRALATLSLAEVCLQQLEQKPKKKPDKRKLDL